MKNSLRTLVAATFAACILPAAALGQTASGGSPGSWLSEYAGARTVGLGGAFVATADDALGVLWNPAGLQWMDQNQAMFAPETYPTEFRGGASLQLLNGRAHMSAEVDQASGPGTRFHGGAEYWIQPGIAMRFGYAEDGATGGFSYRFGPAYQFDYGAADHPLGLSHRVGFSYRFGGFYASNKAEPEVFSPTGDKAVTKISLNARTKAEAQSWSLEIVSKSSQVVRRFGGPGMPPAHVLWDGKDETGLPVADGVYTYRLTVKDTDGRLLNASTRKVEISTGGPQVTVPVQTNP